MVRLLAMLERSTVSHSVYLHNGKYFEHEPRTKRLRHDTERAGQAPSPPRNRDDQQKVAARRDCKETLRGGQTSGPEEFLRCLGAWSQSIPRPNRRAAALILLPATAI